jgi:phosphate transport system substrate-binding protein
VLAFFDWAYQHGDVDAVRLDYAPLPAAVKERVRNQWATTIRDATGQSLYAPAS